MNYKVILLLGVFINNVLYAMEHNRPSPDERRLWSSVTCTQDGVMFDGTLSSMCLKEKNSKGNILYYFPKETGGLAQGKSLLPAFPELETGLQEIGSRFGDRLRNITDKSLYMDKDIVYLIRGRVWGSCFVVTLNIDLQTSSNYGLFKVFYKEGFNRETIDGWIEYYTDDGNHSAHSQFNHIVIPGVVARREITRFGKAVIGGSIFAIGLGLLWRLWPKKS